MTEFLRRAWLGWNDYKGSGKMVALLLAVLLFIWFARKGKEQAALLVYTSVMSICCILPVTAAVLMAYQTKFYDYEWIWSMVPLTAVTAYGIILFLTWLWEDYAGKSWRKVLPVTLFLGATLLFCGSMGGDSEAREKERAEKEEACHVMELLSQAYPEADICLWAPRKILEYAREEDAGCRLVYGRNMWDISLDAYAYDVYDDRAIDLCKWMDWIGKSSGWMPDEDREEMASTLQERAEDALELGANCVLFPADAMPEMVAGMEEALGIKAQRLGEYLVFAVFQEAGQ